MTSFSTVGLCVESPGYAVARRGEDSTIDKRAAVCYYNVCRGFVSETYCFRGYLQRVCGVPTYIVGRYLRFLGVVKVGTVTCLIMSELHSIEQRGIQNKALQVLEKRDRAFRVLCDTVLQVEWASDEQIFSILCCNLRKISGAEGAALASYDPASSTLTLEAVDVEGGNGRSSTDGRLGYHVVITPGQVNVLSKKRMREYRGCDLRLVDLFSELVPIGIERAREAKSYLFPCAFGGKFIAASLLWLHPGQRLEIEDIGVVDVYLSTVGIILQRMYALRALNGGERGLCSLV